MTHSSSLCRTVCSWASFSAYSSLNKGVASTLTNLVQMQVGAHHPNRLVLNLLCLTPENIAYAHAVELGRGEGRAYYRRTTSGTTSSAKSLRVSVSATLAIK